MDRDLVENRLDHASSSAVMLKRVPSKFWPRLRFVTTIAALLVIGISARLNLEAGSFSAFAVGPVRIADPLGVAQVMLASQEFIPGLALAGLLGLGSIVLFGRAFCSWLCPGRWLFNRGPFQARQPWSARPWIQSGIVGSVLGLSWIFHTPVFCIVCPAGVVCRGAIAAGTGGSLLPTFGWLSAVLGSEWLSKRSWCRDLCPLGAAISRVSRFNFFFKVRANVERCRPCVACERACPEGLNLSRDADFSVCTKCLACQAACPRGAVEIEMFARP